MFAEWIQRAVYIFNICCLYAVSFNKSVLSHSKCSFSKCNRLSTNLIVYKLFFMVLVNFNMLIHSRVVFLVLFLCALLVSFFPQRKLAKVLPLTLISLHLLGSTFLSSSPSVSLHPSSPSFSTHLTHTSLLPPLFGEQLSDPQQKRDHLQESWVNDSDLLEETRNWI